MELRVLGQLEAWRDGEQLPLGSFKQRSLVALLLINANQVVSADRIIDELWTDEAAADRHNALWVQVSKLRAILEPEREPRSEGNVLVTRVPGYVLRVDPGDVDVSRFEHLVMEGRALIESDPAAASVVLGEALGLSRGRPYEDFVYEPFAQSEIARLDELRVEAVEMRLDADLRRGLAAELVAELQGLVHEHPLREQLTAQLMVALYRCGRQAESLRAYGQLRSRLVEELGLDPSPALEQLEAEILRRDPALDQHDVPPGSPSRLAVRGYELRDVIGASAIGTTYRAYQPAVGREVAITVIEPELANDSSFIRRFQADGEVVARLEHPHIVPLYDFWREPDHAYLVTRLFLSGTLETALSSARLTTSAAVSIIEDVASALTLAHDSGVVHGRIEPGTIFVDDAGRGFLSGFGVATAETTSTYQYASPEQRAGGAPTPASDICSLGLVLARAIGGDPRREGGPPAALATVVARATAVEPAARFSDAGALANALRDALHTREPLEEPVDLRPPVNPYKGLYAFGEADAGDFFGRERLVERLLARLGSSGVAGRFAAVVGPSGSGKSSAVRAGLLPAVRAGVLPGSGNWFVVHVTPGHHPYEALAAALRDIAVDPPADLLEQLTADVQGIGRTVRCVLPDERAQMLLVVDQFEEIFTLADPSTCRGFVDALTAAVEDRHSRLRVVITLRADFYDRPLRHRGLGELLRRATELITVMSPQELQRAIEQPAAQVGVRFEAGLVAQIVSDVAEHPAALPLLQYSLTELFERRRGNLIEPHDYADLGGAAGALVRRAEAVYRDFDAASREITRQVMLRLITVGDGETGDVTRRRVLRQELLGLGDERVAVVLDTLARHRLLAFDRDAATRSPTVEIAHEAVFVEWDRLRTWISDGREDVRRHRRLAAAAEEWRAKQQESDYLLRGTRLDESAVFAAGGAVTLTPPERRFLDASLTQRDTEQAEEQIRKARESRLRRSSRRRAVLLTACAVVLAIVASIATVAALRRRDAERSEAARENAGRLAAASADVALEDPELAMLLALQSLASSERAGDPASTQAEEALHWGIQAAGVTYPLADASVRVRQGPNGPTGTFEVPIEDLVELARQNVTRGFTADECARFSIAPCPTEGLASPAATGPARVPARVPSRSSAEVSRPLAGTTITIQDFRSDRTGLGAEIEAFEERTGIDVIVRTQMDYGDVSVGHFADGSRPDVTFWWAPGGLNDLAEDGQLIDLGVYLDRSAARSELGPFFDGATGIGSGFHWVPLYIDVESLVWYSPPAFEEAGYKVPHTWEGLLDLSNQMVADGQTPWCVKMPSIWLESLVLQVGGPDVYDRWTSHGIPFNDPTVRRAAAMFEDFVSTPGFISGGPDHGFRYNVVTSMLDRPPACWMFAGYNLTLNYLPAGARPGENIDYFPLPSLEEGAQPPLLLGGLMAAARSDRPEVREFMRQIVERRADGTRWGEKGAADPTGNFIPARPDLGVLECTDPATNAVAANVVRIHLCEDVRDALATGNWRFIASNLMPGAIGTYDADGNLGAYEQAIDDFYARGAKGIDEVLAEVEDAWP